MLTKTITAALAATMLAGAGAALAADISGAGATAPAPVYQAWAAQYAKVAGTHLNYQAIGSGGGIKQIYAKTVEFGASDKPVKPEDLASHGLVQFPTVIVGIVPVVNLPGIAPGQVKLNGSVLADIYLGAVTRWNDPRIAGLNRGVRLPNLPITVVHRSDGSGTTFLFTSYLAKTAPQWGKVGANDSVNWPVGQGGKGNDGVSAFVRNTPGAVGAPGPSGRGQLADLGRDLHPHVQGPAERRGGRRRAEVLRLGLQERRPHGQPAGLRAPARGREGGGAQGGLVAGEVRRQAGVRRPLNSRPSFGGAAGGAPPP